MATYFQKALADFMQDYAWGGAVRHLADQGCTVEEILQELDGSAPEEAVAKMVWKRYEETGIILREPPKAGHDAIEKVTYVKVQGKYGRISMKRVTEKLDLPGNTYLACDFGKRLYQDREAFLRRLETADRRDRAYILGLPWPLQMVYHVEDERMRRLYPLLK